MSEEVQDQREPGWFWLDNEVLEVFGPKIGISGVAVYCALLKFAQRDSAGAGSSFPAVPTIAKMLDCTPPTVRKALDKLEEVGLIKIQERKEDKLNLTNLYIITPVKKFLRAGGTQNSIVPPKNNIVPPLKNIEEGTKKSFHELDPYNKTNINKTSTSTAISPDKLKAIKLCKGVISVKDDTIISGATNSVIHKIVDNHPLEWVEAACNEAGACNARTLNFVLSVLSHWTNHGFKCNCKTPKAEKPAQPIDFKQAQQQRTSVQEMLASMPEEYRFKREPRVQAF